MWPGLIQLAKEGGANVIESYVFWNGHELSPDNVSWKMCEFILSFLFSGGSLLIYQVPFRTIYMVNGDLIVLFWRTV